MITFLYLFFIPSHLAGQCVTSSHPSLDEGQVYLEGREAPQMIWDVVVKPHKESTAFTVFQNFHFSHTKLALFNIPVKFLCLYISYAVVLPKEAPH